jgi:hypothetical protein
MEWIAIKDQKPLDYDRVLYFDNRGLGNISVGYFVWSQTPVDYVTHWMPLPEPPYRKCSDCGTEFKSNGRCPECNPMG